MLVFIWPLVYYFFLFGRFKGFGKSPQHFVRNSNNELPPRIWRWRDVGCTIRLSYLIDICI